MQLNLTGFLEKNTPKFMNSLWKLLLSAQDAPHGIPPRLIEETKAQIREKQASMPEIKKEDKEGAGTKVSAIEELKRQDEEGAFRGRGRGGGFRGGRGGGRGYGGRGGDEGRGGVGRGGDYRGG